MRIVEESFGIEIASGASSKTLRFRPTKSGLVTGCNIHTNGAANAGFVRAKITTDSNEDIAPLSHISNYRSREGGSYRDSQKPVYFETNGKDFLLTVTSTAPFTADFIADLTLVYENDYTKTC